MRVRVGVLDSEPEDLRAAIKKPTQKWVYEIMFKDFFVIY